MPEPFKLWFARGGVNKMQRDRIDGENKVECGILGK